ncbi:MAG: TetR/AcrR family transcriptional regulator [Deltaproteobacteria bacterium]|nr:TetR/AcrR family transcriptional regulator [Deltaproteobacteria bacterium]MBI3389409.1 TetR/AcrR family transcriptional regulator [Deltaproteobacteria bacterium]
MSRRTATAGNGGNGAGEGRATRDLILDAAEQHFAARGFAGVSLRAIATDAGLKNPASLYTHFRNKRALYESVLARGLDPISRVIALSGRGGQAPSLFLDRVFDCLIAHPHLPRLIQRAALDDGAHLRTALTAQLRPLYGTGMRVLAGTTRGWPRADLPHVAAGLYQLIFGYFANATLLAAVAHGDPLSPAALARQRRFLKRAVAQLLGANGAGKRGANDLTADAAAAQGAADIRTRARE